MGTSSAKQRILFNAAIAVMTVFAWCQMFFGWGGQGGLLLARGIGAFKYFTVLSNVFSGIVSGWVAFSLARGRAASRWQCTLKLSATTCVALTFLVVAVFLGPPMGWLPMYMGANLWLHLVLPLAAIVEFCLFEQGELQPRADLLALIPVALYGIGYAANVLINGVGEWPQKNDFYGFAQWGLDKTPLVIAVIAAVTWLMARIIIKLRERFLR